jgi:hypothetical protein
MLQGFNLVMAVAQASTPLLLLLCSAESCKHAALLQA